MKEIYRQLLPELKSRKSVLTGQVGIDTKKDV